MTVAFFTNDFLRQSPKMILYHDPDTFNLLRLQFLNNENHFKSRSVKGFRYFHFFAFHMMLDRIEHLHVKHSMEDKWSLLRNNLVSDIEEGKNLKFQKKSECFIGILFYVLEGGISFDKNGSKNAN